MEQHHRGERPKFFLKVAGFYRSALSRQMAEAVRIRRRGGEGAVLNSKAEYNRCYVPRLRLVEEQEAIEVEQAEAEELQIVREELDREDRTWERSKNKNRRSKNTPTGSSKPAEKHRRELGGEARPSKRRKYALIGEGWGAKTTSLNLKNPSSIRRSKDDSLGEELGANREMEEDGVKVSWRQDDPHHPPEDDLATIPGAGPTPVLGGGYDNSRPSQVIPEAQDVPDIQPSSDSTIPDKDGRQDATVSSDEPEYIIGNREVMMLEDVVRGSEGGDSGGDSETLRNVGGCLKNEVETGDSVGMFRNTDIRYRSSNDNTAMPTPSLSGTFTGVGDNTDAKCVLSDKGCSTHGCDTRVIKVSSKRWLMNKRTGLYGNKTVKVDRLICTYKNGGPKSRMVTKNEARASGESEFLSGALGNNLESSRTLNLCESESTGS